MTGFPKKLLKKLREREINNALRSLAIKEDLIDFSSNDYLGFANNATLNQMAIQILSEKGISQNGATGSRLLTGNTSLHLEVEQFVCDYHQAEEALIFNSGYDANVGFFSSVPQRNDMVIYDEYIHASIRDGIQMGNAKSLKFKHNNLEDLLQIIDKKSALIKDEESEVYLVTEAIFSMDGDTPDFKQLGAICDRYGIRLVVDEAHSIGIFEAGGGQVFDKDLEQQIFARILTFGKALGCHGAAILGTRELKNYLVNFARSFIYTTGLPPHSMACILAAYKLLTTELATKKQQLLKDNIIYFKAQLQKFQLEPLFIESCSAIHCCVLRGNEYVKMIAEEFRKQGIDVSAILSPTVPEGEERLRFCLHAFNNEQEIEKVLKILTEHLINFPSVLKKD